MSLLPLATETWDNEEYRAINRVLRSKRFTMGEEVVSFEAQFAKFFGSRFALMVNSGSSANLLMLAALRYHPSRILSSGDEIIVPAVSWSTTFYPVNQLGMKLRFVDVNLKTLNLNADLIASAITSRTRAIFAVNLLGNPCDFDELEELCKIHNLLLIEDNCESMGASLHGRMTGTFGFCGSFSTFFSHHISTMEGGVIVTDDEKLYHTMLSMRAHGWLREQPPHSHLNCDLDDFSRLFRFVLPGYNLRPLEMSGAIGKEQLKKLPSFVDARRANAAIFDKLFSDSEYLVIQQETGQSSWFGFSLVLVGVLRGQRGRVVRALNRLGVDTRPIVGGNFLANPVMQHLDFTTHGTFENAERVDRDGMFIGNHHYDISGPLVKIRAAIDKVAHDIFNGIPELGGELEVPFPGVNVIDI